MTTSRTWSTERVIVSVDPLSETPRKRICRALAADGELITPCSPETLTVVRLTGGGFEVLYVASVWRVAQLLMVYSRAKVSLDQPLCRKRTSMAAVAMLESVVDCRLVQVQWRDELPVIWPVMEARLPSKEDGWAMLREALLML